MLRSSAHFFASLVVVTALCCGVFRASAADGAAPAPALQPDAAMGVAAQPGVDPDLLAFLPDTVAEGRGVNVQADDVREIANVEITKMMSSGQAPDRQKLWELSLSIADFLINRQLLHKRAKQEGYAPDEAGAAQHVAGLVAKHGEDSFDKALAMQNTTRAELTARIAQELAVKSWIENAVESKVSNSDEEVRNFYAENKSRFETPEQKQASHILIRVESEANEAEKKAARGKAEAILAQLKDGSDFAELAKAHSSCPSSQQGGDLGYFRRGQMVPAFDEVAFGLDKGKISDVVETPFGFHIIKGGELRAARTRPLEEAREEIEGRLSRVKTGKMLQQLLAALRKEAGVKVLLAVNPAALPTPPAEGL